MSTFELAKKIKILRDAQRKFDVTHTKTDLAELKRLEKEIDELIVRLTDRLPMAPYSTPSFAK